jgi:hypothetical protein
MVAATRELEKVLVGGRERTALRERRNMNDVHGMRPMAVPPQEGAMRMWTDFDIGDGYDFVGQLESGSNWAPVASYGRDGWDAGSWPLVVIGRTLRANKKGEWVTVERVEGDLSFRAYRTQVEQLRGLDLLVEAHWRFEPEAYGDDIAKAVKRYPKGELPSRFYGLFSWARLNASEEANV